MAATKKPTRKPAPDTVPAGEDTSRFRALLQGVLDAPDDDAPRHVLADWLEERGDPRGELIALQIALGAPLHGARARVWRRRVLRDGEMVLETTPTEEEIETRVKQLLRKHQAAWLAPIRRFVRTWRWSRGFVDRVEADAGAFFEGLATIAAETPLAHVELTAMKPPLVAQLGVRPELARLRSLDIHQNRIGPKEASALASPHLSGIERLILWGNPLGDTGIAWLAASPHIKRLKGLHLYRCGLGPAGLRALSEAVFFPKLEELDLNEMEGCDASVMQLFARASSMRDLKLGSGGIGDEGLETLASLPSLARLERLSLTFGNNHTERGARAILDSPHLASLTRVSGLIAYDPGGPLGSDSELAVALRARFGEDAV